MSEEEQNMSDDQFWLRLEDEILRKEIDVTPNNILSLCVSIDKIIKQAALVGHNNEQHRVKWISQAARQIICDYDERRDKERETLFGTLPQDKPITLARFGRELPMVACPNCKKTDTIRESTEPNYEYMCENCLQQARALDCALCEPSDYCFNTLKEEENAKKKLTHCPKCGDEFYVYQNCARCNPAF